MMTSLGCSPVRSAARRCFSPTVAVGRGGYGNLVLSRLPVISRHRMSLRQGMPKPRGAQLMVIDTPRGPPASRQHPPGPCRGERRWQVQRLLGHKLFRSADPLPTLDRGRLQRLAGNALAAARFTRRAFARSPPRPRGFARFLPGWRWAASTRHLSAGPIEPRQAASCERAWPRPRAITCHWWSIFMC